jgi:hypothetical protein
LLEQAEEALYPIPSLVGVRIESPLLLSIGLGRDDRICTHLVDGGEQLVGIVGFVGDHFLSIYGVEKTLRVRAIVLVAASKLEVNEIAEGVRQYVDLGRTTAARSSNSLRSLFFFAPAPC